MIMPSDDRIDWRLAIEETEHALTSTDHRFYGKGNIVYDISQMISRVSQFESRYAKYQNIRTVLQLFVLQHYLHGLPVTLNSVKAPLVGPLLGES
jgi:hypothetical protein